MLVFLVRHAHADPGEPDELRQLSERGRAEAKTLAEQLATHPTPPRVVLTSPLLRARETGHAIARAVGVDLAVEERLAPGADADALREVLVDARGPVATVGHQPDCSEITLAVTGRDPGFPPGGFVELTLDS